MTTMSQGGALLILAPPLTNYDYAYPTGAFVMSAGFPFVICKVVYEAGPQGLSLLGAGLCACIR